MTRDPHSENEVESNDDDSRWSRPVQLRVVLLAVLMVTSVAAMPLLLSLGAPGGSDQTGIVVAQQSDNETLTIRDYTDISDSNGVDLHNEYAYVGQYSSNPFQIFNVSNPDDIAHVATQSSGEGYTRFIRIDDDRELMYMAHDSTSANYGFSAWNISNETNPQRVSDLSFANGTGIARISLSDQHPNKAFLSGRNGDFHVVDTTDPENPSIMGSAPMESAEAISISDDGETAYVTDANTDLSTGNALRSVDISTPSNPQIIDSLTITDPAGLGLDGSAEIAYVGTADDRLIEVDVSQPGSLAEIETLQDSRLDSGGTYQQHIEYANDHLYHASTGANALTVLDTSTSPATIEDSLSNSTVWGSGGPWNLEVHNEIIYTVSFDSSTFATVSTSRDLSGPDDAEIDLQFNRYVPPGESTPYTVEFTEDNSTEDITADVSISSANTSVATVDTNATEIVGASGVNGTAEITATYTAGGEEYTATRTVTVATKTVDNLEILPGTWRFSALLEDITIQVILVAIGAAIVATRAATSWAGLGAMELVLIIGWFGNWVPLGIMLLGLFTALFIGLNLAANIDYSVRRS